MALRVRVAKSRARVLRWTGHEHVALPPQHVLGAVQPRALRRARAATAAAAAERHHARGRLLAQDGEREVEQAYDAKYKGGVSFFLMIKNKNKQKHVF